MLKCKQQNKLHKSRVASGNYGLASLHLNFVSYDKGPGNVFNN